MRLHKRKSPCRQAQGPSNTSLTHSSSFLSQRARIAIWFSSIKPRISTLEAREIMSIMHPASVISRLKKAGDNIVTQETIQYDRQGVLHQIVEYVYLNKDGSHE